MSSTQPRALRQLPSDTVAPQPPRKLNWLYVFAGIILFTVAMMFVSFPAGLYTVFGTHLSSNYTASTSVYGLNFDAIFATIQIPIAGNLGDLFVLSLLIYLGFLLLAAKQGSGLLKSLRGATSRGYEELFSNPLAAMTVLLGATTLMQVVVDTAQSSAGIQTGSLAGDPFSLFVDFTTAPLLEESTFRLIMLGVPVLILTLLILRDFSPVKAARVLWRPSAAWDVDETEEVPTTRSFEGSGASLFPSSDSLKVRAVKPIVYVFLALSSVMFGYAHYASGSGWGPGKITEAALAGVALGYLYVKYGFHTNVLMHWSINYVGSVFSFLAQGLWGVPWTSSTGNFLDYFPSLEIIVLLGIPSTLIVASELFKSATRRMRG